MHKKLGSTWRYLSSIIWNHERKHGEEGNVLIIVAFSIFIILGFGALVLDVGSLYLQQERMQSAVDAAALAGAQNLFNESVPQLQQLEASIAKKNYAEFDDLKIPPPSDSSPYTVKVSGTHKAPLWLAQIWGLTNQQIQVSATAQLNPILSATGVVPIAIPQQTFVYGQEYALTSGAGNGSQGNYGFLDFPGGSLTDNLEFGYSGTIHIGDQIPTDPGMRVGQVAPAIEYRMNEPCSAGCNSFETATDSCPRVMLLPVVDSIDVNGKKPVTVVGFAAFYLDGYGSDQNGNGHDVISGRFMRLVHQGTGGTSLQDDGAYIAKLVQQ